MFFFSLLHHKGVCACVCARNCKCFSDICNLKIKKPCWTVQEKKENICALKEELNKEKKWKTAMVLRNNRVTGGQGQ